MRIAECECADAGRTAYYDRRVTLSGVRVADLTVGALPPCDEYSITTNRGTEVVPGGDSTGVQRWNQRRCRGRTDASELTVTIPAPGVHRTARRQRDAVIA